MKMGKTKYLLVIPMCCMLMLTPASSMEALAVTVDINDNYDAGLIGEELDSGNTDNSGNNTAEGGSGAQTPATPATSTTPATPATATANNVASTNNNATEAVSTVTPAETTAETNDLPRTGDDNRITITFIAMLASFSVFLTALLSGKRIGKNV
ncbi:hypothetical protein [Butyrivibrio sp. AE3004]|uniref:hypothetical protein n=1 Tax=Butyrivibrio sp. AE3004 TaxID=1506994 RepID=UPI000493C88C|nr:hypothetical protein [Butyrivibrio sp. AE3004]